jgi:uncharacterized protein HemY
MGRFKQALEVFFKTEILLERPDPEVYHHIGELIYRNFGQPKVGPEAAKEYLKQAVVTGKHVGSYKILAEIYIQENDHVKAIEMIENCLLYETSLSRVEWEENNRIHLSFAASARIMLTCSHKLVSCISK